MVEFSSNPAAVDFAIPSTFDMHDKLVFVKKKMLLN